MAKTSYPFIKSFRGDRKSKQLWFIGYVQNWYQGTQRCDSRFFCSCVLKGHIHGLHEIHYFYNYGFIRGWITISFDWFRNLVVKDLDISSIYAEKRVYKHYPAWRERYEVPTKYQRLTHHQEKSPEWREELTESVEWRNKKRSKSQIAGWRKGPGPYYKQLRASKHRAWSKSNIKRENWDIFASTSQTEYTQFVDSYCWD